MGQIGGKQFNEADLDNVIDVLMGEMQASGNASNQSHLWNISREIWNQIIRERDERNVSLTAEVVLIVIYSILIVLGLVTNVLVVFVVARRRQMHTARNSYIVNLTIADISMCFICMPFTLIMILRRTWVLGPILCKLVHVLQGTNVMVAVGTITVIALDRYFTICRRTTEDMYSARRRVVFSIVLIWIFSVCASMPLFFYEGLEVVMFEDLVLYEVCIEQWPSKSSKVLYDVVVLLVMAVIPPVVVATVHFRIATYLNAHTKNQKDSARARREIQRNKRTTLLLSVIVIIFAVSWLPLAGFSLVADLVDPKNSEAGSVYIALAVVHIFAMSSAISNPVVYGWLNSNIRKEFLSLLPEKCAALCEKKSKKREDGAVENETLRTQVNLHTTTQDKDRRESVALLVSLSRRKSLISAEVPPQNSTHL